MWLLGLSLATPATYMIDSKRYIIIATSNARSPKGSYGAASVTTALLSLKRSDFVGCPRYPHHWRPI